MRVSHLFLLCIPLLMGMEVHSQDQRVVDSLQDVLANQKVADRFFALYELTFEYLSSDQPLALQFIEQAERSALLSGDSLSILKSKRVRSQILYLLNEPHLAIATIHPLLRWDLPHVDPYEHHAVLDHLGLCHGLIGQFDRSMEFNFQALEVANELGDVDLITTSLKNIGFTYYKLKDYRKAQQYFWQAQANSVSEKGKIWSYINLSLVYSHLNQFDSAKFYLKQHELSCGQECADGDRMHRAYASGCMYFRMGRFKEAEGEFLYSLNLARKLNDSRIQLDNIYLLSKISLKNSRRDFAAAYLKEGEELIQSNVPFNIEMIKVFSELADFNLSGKNYPKAAEYQAKYIALKDSIYNESVTNRLIEIEAHFLERRNEARIAEQEKIIFLNREIIRRQQILNFLSGVIVLLTGAIIFYLVRSYRRKQAVSILLDQKVRDRTCELENTREELLNYIREKEALFGRSWSGIHANIKTLKGLCHTAHAEVADPVAQLYLEKIDTISREVDRQLRASSE